MQLVCMPYRLILQQLEINEKLERMDDDIVRCAFELSDAAFEVQAYACLVAIMSRGHGYHKVSEQRLF